MTEHGSPRMARVLAVDDSAEILSVVRRGLQRHGYEVVGCGDGRTALEAFRHDPPDLVILDLRLPDIDGLDLCMRFQEIERVPVIMLTARDAVADRVQGLRAGADDYVVKPFELDELVARGEAVLRRRPPGTRELTYDDLRIDLDRRRVHRGTREVPLTRTEFDILEVLARRADRVVSRDGLASAVWPDGGITDDSVLDSHVTNLRRKLESGGEGRIVQTVRGIGFTLR